ncbi:MAG: glycoside hydrolase, partial [Asticcacaulis sp.]|nr:glycoside hydrolase [Asticcacaulis sp.]
VLVFSNWYDGLFSDSKISGVELIQQGVRTATNGDVRMMPTPGQWDEIGLMLDRKVDAATGTIETTVKYAAYDFTYVIRAVPQDDGVNISVVLDKPLPDALAGRAGFNLEFLPAAYFHKSYMADGAGGQFPLYPSGPMKSLGPGKQESAVAPQTEPEALATAKTFVLAPEDPARRVTITSADGEISLYDGRNQAQNGWYVFRVRAPVIGHSQLGYAPHARKVAVIEADPNDTAAPDAQLLKLEADGSFTPVLTGPATKWGRYLRYDYLQFDFTPVKAEGLYVIDYKGQRTTPFRIAADVYAKAWQPTLDVYMPVAMDHMMVNEAYRVWHGDAHRDDAMQASVNDDHIDLYASKGTTDTQYKPYEHIPGLNVGGWFDAGDFDIRTQTHYSVVRALVEDWEKFHIDRDDTLVDHDRRFVDIHVPDGKPDLLQQIQHGTLQLVAQFDAVGHAINGIVEPDVLEYTHLGDAVTKTDGL